MKNQMRYFVWILLLFPIACQEVSAQCNPPMDETCDGASSLVLCSLNELNGYSCSNLSTIASPCSPICSQGGIGNNTSWWGFVTDGGTATITLTVGSCLSAQGLEFGVWGNCSCGEEIVCRSNPCTSPGTSKSVSVYLAPCKPYFLWVDGCNGDVCDFTINTSGGPPPTISPLSKINNKADMIIDVCDGACFTFFVDPSSGGCQPSYKWTWDGNLLADHTSRSFETDITSPVGDYTLCVTAFISVRTGSLCTQQGPQCATIKIRKLPEQVGLPRAICPEQTNSGGYKWFSKKIVNSGIYRQSFSNNICCRFDSIVEFTVLESPQPVNVYYITCDNKPYIDVIGKKHLPCLKLSNVILPKLSSQYKCDSSIILTAINVDFAPIWTAKCIGGKVELIPNVKIVKPCDAGESYEFEYKWYKKSDPTKIIGSDERLMVNAVPDDYCLEVKVRTELETEIAVCTKTFCETFDEGNLAPECAFKLEGYKVFCFDPIAVYRIDSLFSPKVNFYTWTVTGGVIVSNPDSSVVQVKWAFNPQDSGKVCVSYNTDCGTSCQKCLPVFLEKQIAGFDFEKRGLSTYLDARPNPNGSWRLISGPHQVRIIDPTNPRTRISAFNYGFYCFEWTINDPNCVIKDTICVDLHSFPTTSPEYPDKIFDDRAGSVSDHDPLPIIIYTPNLIGNTGESFVSIQADLNCKINYRWFDIYGRAISHDEVFIEPGIYRLNINSPLQEGMCFLVIEINGVASVRKVCVID